jgi:CheY-like chemotaxis protein
MKRIIYYLDDIPEGRRDLRMQLRALFEPDFEVTELPMEQDINRYLGHIHHHPVAAIFIDQNLDESGAITGYTGVKLASLLRTVLPDLPLYLVTAHLIQGELESEEAGNAEAVVAKTTLLLDSASSRRFRLQFLRRVGQYEKALSENQRRFRELLPRKLRGELSSDELAQYQSLKSARDLVTEAAEEASTTAMQQKMLEIKKLLSEVERVRNAENS